MSRRNKQIYTLDKKGFKRIIRESANLIIDGRYFLLLSLGKELVVTVFLSPFIFYTSLSKQFSKRVFALSVCLLLYFEKVFVPETAVASHLIKYASHAELQRERNSHSGLCIERDAKKREVQTATHRAKASRANECVCVFECSALALFWLSLFVSGAGTVAISRGNFILFVFAAKRQKCIKGTRPLQSANRLAKTS